MEIVEPEGLILLITSLAKYPACWRDRNLCIVEPEGLPSVFPPARAVDQNNKMLRIFLFLTSQKTKKDLFFIPFESSLLLF